VPLVLLLLIAWPASSFETGRVRLGAAGLKCAGSRDARHYACAALKDGRPVMTHDGRLVAEGGLAPAFTLSDDGLALAVARNVRESDGSAALQIEVNGKPKGPAIPSYNRLAVGIDGSIAIVAKSPTGQGFVVVTSDGISPVFDKEPPQIFVSPSGAPIFTAAKGGRWHLFIGTQPHDWAPDGYYPRLFPSLDYKRLAGTYVDPSGQYMIVDGQKYGPYRSVHQEAAYSPDNKGFAFVLSKEGEPGRRVLVDGKTEYKLPAKVGTLSLSLRPGDLKPFTVVSDQKSEWMVEGEKSGRKWAKIHQFNREPAVAFAPGGRSHAYAAQAAKGGPWSVVVDGTARELVGVSEILSPLAFDNASEFRFIARNGKRVELVCLSVSGVEPEESACLRQARKARARKAPTNPD
jgi:hypothetical protein